MGSKLGSEIVLVCQMERVGEAVVSFLECPHSEATNVLYAYHFGGSAGTKGGAPYTGIAQFLDDIRKNILTKD